MIGVEQIRDTLRRSRFRGIARAARNTVVFGGLPVRDGVRFLTVGTVYVSRDDHRGQALLARHGVFQPRNLYLWRRLAALAKPDLVLDVGANYGDLVLATRYPPGTRIHAFEPNPAVLPYLRRSAASHGNAATITIHECLVTDRDGGSRDFTVDHRWSGTSSAIGSIGELPDELTGGEPESVSRMQVAARSIDAVLDSGRGADGLSLLFKIDVEGFEGHALRGMAATLASAARYSGLIEYEPARLARAGTDPVAMVRQLSERATVLTLTRDGGMMPAPPDGRIDEAGELVVTTEPDLVARLKVPAICG